MAYEQTISENLRSIWFLMGQARFSRDGHRGYGSRGGLDISRGKGRILALLKLKDGVSTKDLAEIVGIRVSSLNETLSKMENEGLIERHPSDDDKRVMLIFITETGRNTKLEKPRDLDLFKGFSEDELEQLAHFTQRMVENAEAAFPREYLDDMNDIRKRREEFFGPSGCGGRDFRPPMGMGFGGCGPRMHHHQPHPHPHHHERMFSCTHF